VKITVKQLKNKLKMTTEKLYTFVMTYRDGIYIHQVWAINREDAKKKWAENINPYEIKYFGTKSKQKLIANIANEDEVLLQGLINAWCFDFAFDNGFATINMIETNVSL